MTPRSTPEVVTKVRGTLVAVFLFAVLTAGLFWPVLFQGKTLIATDFLHASPLWGTPSQLVRNKFLSDTMEYYYPAERIYSEHVKRGELPLVNPYVFNGARVPHGIHIWNSVWPVKIAFLLLFDPVRSYDFFAIFHFWLAALAMYAFLSRGIGVGGFPAFAGALAYVLSSRSMTWLHGHYLMPTMAYAPLVLLAAKHRSLLGALPMAGLFFTNPHMAIAVGFVAFLYEKTSWRATLVGMLLAGVALVPLAVTLSEGQRHPFWEANYFYRDRWKCWLLLAGLVEPNLFHGSMTPNEWNAYLGLLPLAGAIAGMKQERFFSGLALVALAIATVWPLPILVSPVSISLPTRYLLFFTLGACVCFARALEDPPFPRWVQTAIVLLILVDLVPRYLKYNEPYDPSPLRERPPVAEVLRGRVGWSLKDHPQLPRSIFPPLSMLGIESLQGYDVTVPRDYERTIRGAAKVTGDRAILLTDPESPILDGLGMRYFITDKPFEPKRFRKVWSGAVEVYENPSAKEVAPRTISTAPLRIGLGVTLAGCLLAVLLGVLDRRRREAL